MHQIAPICQLILSITLQSEVLHTKNIKGLKIRGTIKESCHKQQVQTTKMPPSTANVDQGKNIASTTKQQILSGMLFNVKHICSLKKAT